MQLKKDLYEYFLHALESVPEEITNTLQKRNLLKIKIKASHISIIKIEQLTIIFRKIG